MEFDRLLKNRTYRSIIRFFHENPASIDTGRGIATWTNQDIKKVRAALKRLSKMGILIANKVSSTTGYSYTRDKKKISKISRVLKKHR
jgi:predicted transcriptional regulator